MSMEQGVMKLPPQTSNPLKKETEPQCWSYISGGEKNPVVES